MCATLFVGQDIMPFYFFVGGFRFSHLFYHGLYSNFSGYWVHLSNRYVLRLFWNK